MGPAILVTVTDETVGLPTFLSGTQVFFDGLPAPLLYTSDQQVSAIAPFAINGQADTAVTVQYLNTSSNTVKVPVSAASPGLFTVDGHQAAAVNQDGVVNDFSHPALPESVVVFYGTGAGQTVSAGIDGLIPPNQALPQPLQPLGAILGGTAAQVIYGGAAPAFPSGIFQMNVRVPQSSGSGHIPISITSGDQTNPPAAILTVAPSTPVGLEGITLDPVLASGGTTISINAVLSDPAPTEGAWIGLASNNAALNLPPAIFVPAGSRTTSLLVAVPSLDSAADILVTGMLFQPGQPRQVHVLPPAAAAKVVSITSQPSSSAIDITVTIAAPAPQGGIAVALTSGSSALTLPANITIPAGSTVGHLTVPYSSGSPATGAVIQAVSGTSSTQTVVAQAIPGRVDDSPTDVTQSGSDPAPNLTSVSVTASNNVVTFHARFTAGSYSAHAVTVFSLDTDRNPNSGWQGNYPDNSDPGFMGTDTVIATGGSCYGSNVSVYRYDSSLKLMRLARSYAVVTVVNNGFDIQIPATVLGSQDFNFRAETWQERTSCGYAGASDAAPDIGNMPGRSAMVAGPLPAPEMLASSDPLTPATPATLQWSTVDGALFYILAIDETSGNGFSSDKTGLPRLLLKVVGTNQQVTYDGQPPARWRVWAVDADGQAGAPSAWR